MPCAYRNSEPADVGTSRSSISVSLHEWPYADQHLAYLAPATDDSFFIELLGDGQPRRSYRKHAIEFIEARNRRTLEFAAFEFDGLKGGSLS